MSPQPNGFNELALFYIGFDEVRLAGGQRLELPARYEYCFAFVMQQSIRITIAEHGEESSIIAVADELFLISPNSICTLHNRGIQQTSVALIRFRCEPANAERKADVCKESLPYKDATGLKLFRMPQARSWIQEFQKEIEKNDIGLYYQQQAQLYAMAAALISSLQQSEKTAGDLNSYIEWTKQFMLEQFNTPMDMEELARSSGLSASRFYQAFRAYTGLSPLKYLTKMRLDASLELLSGSSSSIVEIAHSVGYPDEYYFSRLFKKQMGLAPTEYGNLAKKKIATLVSVFTGDLSALGMTASLSFVKVNHLDPAGVVRQLREVEPELILAGKLDDEMYAACSSIAPVIMLDWKSYSWKERLIKISALLGLTSVAERWLSYYALKVKNARVLLRNSMGDKPLLVVQADSFGFRLFGMRCRKMKDLFYDDLHIMPPPALNQLGMTEMTSLEEIAQLGCSRIMFLVPSIISNAYCAQLEGEWNRLMESDEERKCMFITYNDRLNYNPTVHDALIDEAVRQVLGSTQTEIG